jgi:excisionase family DNA binding protein
MPLDLEAIIEASVERAVRRALADQRPEIQPELLTVAQAAELAQVSGATIRQWVVTGSLNRYGSARKLRVRRDELLRVQQPATEQTADDIVVRLLGRR